MGDLIRTSVMFFLCIGFFLFYLVAGFIGVRFAYLLVPEPWGYLTGGIALAAWAAVGFTIVTMPDSFP